MKSAFRRGGAILAVGLACFTSPALAQSGEVKIGMITTLSGPGSGLGIDVRDAFAGGVVGQGTARRTRHLAVRRGA